VRGWLLKRITGSHHVFTKEGQRERILVPVHFRFTEISR